MSESENFPLPSYARVVVTISLGPLEKLTYGIPEQFRSWLRSGMRVVVPIGSRKTTGIVIHTGSVCDLPDPSKVKDILDIMDEGPIFPRDLLRLWNWSTNYYLTSLGEMLKTLLPGGLKSESVQIVKLKKEPGQSKRTEEKGRRDSWSVRLATHLTPAEQEILTVLEAKKRVPLKALRRHSLTLSLGKVLQKLEALGVVEISEHLPRRKNLPTMVEAAGAALWEAKHPVFSLSFVCRAEGCSLTHRHCPAYFSLSCLSPAWGYW
jgi:primosomal protein N'